MQLATKILNTKTNELVIPEIVIHHDAQIANQSNLLACIICELYFPGSRKNKSLGWMRIEIYPDAFVIANMFNSTFRAEGYCQGVGAALHEIAFKLSVAYNAVEKIQLKSGSTSHLFHYGQGYRPINDAGKPLTLKYFKIPVDNDLEKISLNNFLENLKPESYLMRCHKIELQHYLAFCYTVYRESDNELKENIQKYLKDGIGLARWNLPAKIVKEKFRQFQMISLPEKAISLHSLFFNQDNTRILHKKKDTDIFKVNSRTTPSKILFL